MTRYRIDKDFYEILAKITGNGNLIKVDTEKEIWEYKNKRYVIYRNDDLGIYTKIQQTAG